MKNLQVHNVHFLEVLEGFAKRLRDQGRPKSNAKTIVNQAREFLYCLENKGIDDIFKVTQQEVDDYITYLFNRPNRRKAGGLSIAYINKHREAVLRLLEYIHEKPLGESGFYIPHYKHQAQLKEILTVEEMVLVYQATDDTLTGITDRVMLSLLYGCGLRKGELHNLEVNDIDFGKGVIRLDNTKTKYERDVVMSPKVQQCLEEYLYNAREIMLPSHSTETHVMVTERGEKMSLATIPLRLKKLIARAGIKKNITPHGLRHSIATHLLEDLSLEEVAQFLGHRHLDSTQVYTHIKEAQDGRF